MIGLWLGIRYGGDTGRYLPPLDAQLWSWWRSSTASYPLFSGYVTLGALARAVFGSHAQVFLVVFQLLAASLAPWFVLRAVQRLAPRANPWMAAAGLLGASLLAFDVLQWHVYILSDSLFLSLGCLFLWRLVCALEGGSWWPAGVAALLLAVWRPGGQLFAALLVLVPMLRWMGSRRRVLLLLAAASLLVSGAFAVWMNTQVADDAPLARLHTRYQRLNSQGIVVSGRPETWRPAPRGVGDYFSLVWVKYAWMWQFNRADYSRLHRLANWLYFLALYLAAAAGLFWLWRAQGGRVVEVLLAWLHGGAFFYALHVVSYDYRYQLILLPVLWLLAAVAVSEVGRRHGAAG
ncbi:MAG: hypothetical protein LJE84_09720 [Gammaproteobacteria bacterium]|nr:hypothetical protein [Gammaproteobacteria bacterium]